ncbi:NAD-dependent epimerase/dehydratase family protein [Chelativorans sp. Marseille-P2723]|uniref:NAD-dependent epimerase/dehydratase family protein n=1 Tax=Chelativorans sp. Marseille-P2723 TaxID=2709133 RepID=UPI00156F4091|nr:NAD-dependent epimerase/dehydratase family protein [Chelativorans sp. Marseille-P2723]
MAQILLTGSTGFVGRHLAPALAASGHRIVEAGRRLRSAEARFVPIGEIGPETRWEDALADVNAVIHLAGLAHRKVVAASDYYTVNDAGTQTLVEACKAAGVGVVIFVSSIAARTAAKTPHEATYGASKRAGEEHVLRFARSGRTAIVLRPPLVYGHDAPGNWRRLQRIAASGLPLPFGAVANRRSLLAVGNLCHAIGAALEVGLRGEGGGIYEISDREPVSLAEILSSLRAGMGLPPRLFPVPARMLRLAARVTGTTASATSLLDDLILDPSPFMKAFDWAPPEKTLEAIAQSGRLYLSR